MTLPVRNIFATSRIAHFQTGFTSWASSREPAHVFVLLQTVCQAFDAIAKRRRVFKVETIGKTLLVALATNRANHLTTLILLISSGDSYVAVTGLPKPQTQHAWIMAMFACECRQKFLKLSKKLETVLGPDTSDLGMRVRDSWFCHFVNQKSE